MRRIHSPDACLAVDYMIETSPTSVEGGQMGGITDIEFHEGYVVVKAGACRVFFSGRTKILGCSKGKR